MIAQDPNAPCDPKRKIRLEALRGLYVAGKNLKPGDAFELEAREIEGCMVGFRYKFANDTDRSLVFKKTYVFA